MYILANITVFLGELTMSAGADGRDGMAKPETGNSKKSILQGLASRGETKVEPNGYPQDEVLKYVISAFDGDFPMTLRDAYERNPKYSWDHFLSSASQLVADGTLKGEGDGFVVKYFLATKGRNAVGRAP